MSVSVVGVEKSIEGFGEAVQRGSIDIIRYDETIIEYEKSRY